MQNGIWVDAKIALSVSSAYIIASNLTGFAWIHELTKMNWKRCILTALSSSLSSSVVSLLILPMLVREITNSTPIFLLAESIFLLSGIPQVWITDRFILKSGKFRQIRILYVWHICSLGFLYLFLLVWIQCVATS